MQITIADKLYTVTVAKTDEEQEQGLGNTESLPKDEGMLFDFSDEPQEELTFNTVEMNYPIDIVFIDTNLEVIAVVEGKPHSDEVIECTADDNDKIQYVLEVNSNSGIKVGDELEFEDDSEITEDEVNKLYIVGPDGKSQMMLVGGERIVSRKETRVLIRKAKKADQTKSDGAYRSLGKYLFKVLDGQNNREPEYVEGPEGRVETKKGE